MSRPKNKETSLLINIDGASKGNPGPAGIGVVIRDASDGQTICDLSEHHGEMTNNAVEYVALIRALEYAVILGAQSVMIQSDSQLLVRQMTGEYRVKSANIEPLYLWAADLARILNCVDFEYIPRENNKEADTLAQQALRGVKKHGAGRAAAFPDRKGPGGRKVRTPQGRKSGSAGGK